MLRYIETRGTPRERGRQHGEMLRDDIRTLTDIRRELLYRRSPIQDSSRIAQLAEEQWHATAARFPHLAEELDGIREASGISRENLVILNNYTDFRDIGLSDQGCTSLYVRQGEAIYLAQTWDMHQTAEPFVVGLVVDDAVLLTVAGCIGMMGLNDAGVGVVVNNLTSTDAGVGVMWPAVVRGMLEKFTVGEAVGLLLNTTLCSGHNYMVASRDGCRNVETTGRRASITFTAGPIDTRFFHTNHYLDAELRSCEAPISKLSTTRERYGHMQATFDTVSGAVDIHTIVGWLSSHDGHPRSICSHLGAEDPDASKTCGGVVCDITAGEVIGWQGCLHEPGQGTVRRAVPRGREEAIHGA